MPPFYFAANRASLSLKLPSAAVRPRLRQTDEGFFGIIKKFKISSKYLYSLIEETKLLLEK
jgi:hypothetical protein